MEQIFYYSNRIINNVNTGFKRYLFNTINWDNKLIEITGARGVGKTTLMLQRANLLNLDIPNQAVYISLDDQLMYDHSIADIAGELEKYGVKYLFLDEVHKYPPKRKDSDWSAEIKNSYDRYPDLKIIYSGSSVLKIYKGHGDLSRRKTSYRLAGLSFREFLDMKGIARFNFVSLDELLSNHLEISSSIVEKIKIIPLFREYLRSGYYPFVFEDPSTYFDRLNSILNVIIEVDIPAVSEIKFDTSLKLKKLLAAIASSVPYVPNLLNIRNNLFIADQRTLLKYLDFLEKAEVICNLSQKAKGNKLLQKPDRIYLGNTNFLYSLSFNPQETGTVRETFFNTQLSVLHKLLLPKSGGFLVDDKYLFEIGGRNKSGYQIKDTKNAFLALDDIESGVFNQIPLWLFGFLY